ncbi:tRNA lysidine(34) synthetase TilS [Amaricoccus tamworthensis]|uniref:tRNA lysidine(34) synthetase TilS n=1 Tax=Amaricoccus tamworthensis TaxID=57002 RepID=UPI003C79D8E7
MRVPERFVDAFDCVVAPCSEGTIGVAVSGGSDSTALILIAKEWATACGRSVSAVTVDHGLRPESADEAASVGEFCKYLDISHQTSVWRGWDGNGNLQARARDARRSLISAWAHRNSISTVALGHTLDDQAETFLMRLARGSGVDGLAAMSSARKHSGINWVRPLLGIRREDLRSFLRENNVSWVDDPSNDNESFERVRWRTALAELSSLGLDAERLATTAEHMSRARETLEGVTEAFLKENAFQTGYGEVTLQTDEFPKVTEDLRLRVVSSILCCVSGQGYRPRFSALKALVKAIVEEPDLPGASLHGCVVRKRKAGVIFRREPSSVSPDVPAVIGCWDSRWTWDLEQVPDGATVGAIAPDELPQVKSDLQIRLPRELLLTLPALRLDGRLIATPVTGMDNQVRFALKPCQHGFNTMTIVR